jgi:hypothetical protein
VQDYIPQKHLARHVVEVVEMLDIRLIENAYSGRRSKAYHPRMLLSDGLPGSTTASSANRQNAFASRICSGVGQSGSKSEGLATTATRARARDVATLRRFGLNRKPVPRGASSGGRPPESALVRECAGGRVVERG